MWQTFETGQDIHLYFAISEKKNSCFTESTLSLSINKMEILIYILKALHDGPQG